MSLGFLSPRVSRRAKLRSEAFPRLIALGGAGSNHSLPRQFSLNFYYACGGFCPTWLMSIYPVCLSPAGMAKDGGWSSLSASGLLVLLFLKLPPVGNGKADFQVLGPQDPVLAVVGEEAELRCWLSPRISAHSMELRWFREELSPAVHVRRAGRDEPEEQMREYRNRTSFVDRDMAGGQAAVRIHRITMSDNGSYHCLFTEDRAHASTTLWLQVAGLGSRPRIQAIHTQDRGVWAECASEGWYPEPWVEWRDHRGQTVRAETNFSVSPTTGLLAVVSRVALQGGAVEALSCSISNSLLPGRKVAESHLPAHLSRGSQFTKWRLALPLALLAMGLVMAGVICLFGKCQRNAHRTQLRQETERRGQEQSQQSSMAVAAPLHEVCGVPPRT
ncbi:butyrophilin-like protein 10 isoform X2 [Heterocephalus glaber]|uniref:Butyrophilin-like protein 10 isoform X2 n=1 Tax=Heterocephalus glaber TaxID=10181 RepID=A0AAX6SGC5_HETGA|nr:butyrophilin-like protein 10 isoform X2 [Heterocephalus glaber]